MRAPRALLRVALGALGALPLQAQTADSVRAHAPAPAIGPPVRRIATASAVSPETFGAINDVRELPGGLALVNDGTRRQLLLVDTTLRIVRVVLDSVSETENTYGTRGGALIPYRGDSTLFIDPVSLALLIIDPSGAIARVRSVPRVQDVGAYASPGSSMRAGTDARGRLLYRISARPAPPTRAPPRGVPYFPQEPDSAFIVGIDIDTRKLDTVGSLRTPKSDFTVRLQPGGGFDFIQSINPLPSTDEWAVLSDGSVAFVRGIDYRIDYLNPDGTWTSSPKVPYDWQRVGEADKKRIVDSLRTAQSRIARVGYTTSLIRFVNLYGKRKYPDGFAAPEGYNLPQGLARDWALPAGVNFPANYIYACAAGEDPTMIPRSDSAGAAGAQMPGGANRGNRPGAGGAGGAGGNPPGGRGNAPGGSRGNPAGGDRGNPPGGDRNNPRAEARAEARAEVRAENAAGTPGPVPGSETGRPSCIPSPIPNLATVPQPPRLREVSVISPDELPDFRPPFGGGAVRADADGNLWIRTVQVRPVPGGQVYDIVSRSGELTDRLQIPPGYTIVGFGRGRVVYLSMRDPSGIKLARVVLKD